MSKVIIAQTLTQELAEAFVRWLRLADILQDGDFYFESRQSITPGFYEVIVCSSGLIVPAVVNRLTILGIAFKSGFRAGMKA